MEQRGVEVDGVMMAAPPLAKVDHAAPSQVPDDSPNGSLSEIKAARDLLNGRIWTRRDIEEHSPLGGQQGPTAPLTVAPGRVAGRSRSLRSPRGLAHGLLDQHSTQRVCPRTFPDPCSAAPPANKHIAKSRLLVRKKMDELPRSLIDGGAAMRRQPGSSQCKHSRAEVSISLQACRRDYLPVSNAYSTRRPYVSRRFTSAPSDG